MLQQTGKAVVGGGTNLVRGTSPGSWGWGSSQEGALSLCTLALLPAWNGRQAPDTFWCFAPGIQRVVQYHCSPSGRCMSWLENRNIPPGACAAAFPCGNWFSSSQSSQNSIWKCVLAFTFVLFCLTPVRIHIFHKKQQPLPFFQKLTFFFSQSQLNSLCSWSI